MYGTLIFVYSLVSVIFDFMVLCCLGLVVLVVFLVFYYVLLSVFLLFTLFSAVLLFYGTSSMGLCLSGYCEINTMMMMMMNLRG